MTTARAVALPALALEMRRAIRNSAQIGSGETTPSTTATAADVLRWAEVVERAVASEPQQATTYRRLGEPRIRQMVPDGHGDWLYADDGGDVYRLRVTGQPRAPLVIDLDTVAGVCRHCGGYGRHIDDGGCPACGKVQPGPV